MVIRNHDTGRKFGNLVNPAIERLEKKQKKVGAFIAETFPSVAGQIIPPHGYLQEVYKNIRNAGGLCIADEVQTGLGRLGEYYFGFEQQEVEPDIVVLGKPIGNGHPIGVVVTTKEIADSFADGPEFFSTFGGSTLSCMIGNEVLEIVDDEGLQENAKQMGDRLLTGLRGIKNNFPQIGDVRGMGLFLGIDLVKNNTNIFSYNEPLLSFYLFWAGIMTLIPLFWYTRGFNLIGIGPASMIFFLTPTAQFFLSIFYLN